MSSRGVKITSTDLGYRNLLKRAGLNHTISVGIHDKEGDEEHENAPGLTVSQVATWLEFGTSRQVARPFIRGWFDENEALAREAISRMAQQVVAGKISREVALERLGQFFVKKIQARMAAGLEPPNRPSTLKRKGEGAKAGIDTGQVRSSVTYQVERR